MAVPVAMDEHSALLWPRHRAIFRSAASISEKWFSVGAQVFATATQFSSNFLVLLCLTMQGCVNCRQIPDRTPGRANHHTNSTDVRGYIFKGKFATFRKKCRRRVTRWREKTGKAVADLTEGRGARGRLRKAEQLGRSAHRTFLQITQSLLLFSEKIRFRCSWNQKTAAQRFETKPATTPGFVIAFDAFAVAKYRKREEKLAGELVGAQPSKPTYILWCGLRFVFGCNIDRGGGGKYRRVAALSRRGWRRLPDHDWWTRAKWNVGRWFANATENYCNDATQSSAPHREPAITRDCDF